MHCLLEVWHCHPSVAVCLKLGKEVYKAEKIKIKDKGEFFYILWPYHHHYFNLQCVAKRFFLSLGYYRLTQPLLLDNTWRGVCIVSSCSLEESSNKIYFMVSVGIYIMLVVDTLYCCAGTGCHLQNCGWSPMCILNYDNSWSSLIPGGIVYSHCILWISGVFQSCFTSYTSVVQSGMLHTCFNYTPKQLKLFKTNSIGTSWHNHISKVYLLC